MWLPKNPPDLVLVPEPIPNRAILRFRHTGCDVAALCHALLLRQIVIRNEGACPAEIHRPKPLLPRAAPV